MISFDVKMRRAEESDRGVGFDIIVLGMDGVRVG